MRIEDLVPRRSNRYLVVDEPGTVIDLERTFPVHSPIIAKMEVVSRGDVRRAKLYYLRDRVGKAGKVKERRFD